MLSYFIAARRSSLDVAQKLSSTVGQAIVSIQGGTASSGALTKLVVEPGYNASRTLQAHTFVHVMVLAAIILGWLLLRFVTTFGESLLPVRVLAALLARHEAEAQETFSEALEADLVRVRAAVHNAAT